MGRKPLAVLAAAFLLALAAPCGAVFVASQMDRIDTEGLLDSEYFLDLLSFTPPQDWERAWSASTGAYLANGASLDCCSLLLSQRLKLEKRLTPKLTMRFKFEQADDKEREETHHWIEAEQELGGGFSAVLLGEPAFRKEDADIGLGAAIRRGGVSAGLRRIFVDWNFNQRGSTSQSYPRLPVTDQLAAAYAFPAGTLSAWGEVDHLTRRLVPAQNKLFSYRRLAAAAAWTPAEPGLVPSIRYSHEFVRRSNSFLPDPTLASIDFAMRRHWASAIWTLPLSERDTLETGPAVLSRSGSALTPSSRSDYGRWELQPQARWRRRHKPWLVSELAAFGSGGEDRRFFGGAAPDRVERVGEAKLGAGLDFVFAAGRIGLNTSWDLDELRGHPWDGGNARLMLFF